MTIQERTARDDRARRESGESDDRRRRHARNSSSERAAEAEHDSRDRGTRQRRTRLSAEQAADRGARYIARFTGKEPETVTQIARSDSGWLVGIEVVEDRRIPSSSDILAVYEVQIDRDGEVDSYQRSARYSRGRGSAEGR